MTIDAVGSFAVSDTDSLAVDPTDAGDIFVVPVCLLTPDALASVQSVSGGGVETWAPLAGSNPSTDTGDAELWWGVIDEVGDSTIEIEIPDGATVQALGAQQFTSGEENATWAIDRNSQSASTDEAASGIYPPVTPSSVFELYVGAGLFNGGNPGGSTPGFVYNEGDPALAQFLYGLNLSWPNILSPEWTADNGFWTACAGLLAVVPPTIDAETIYRTWQNSDGSTPQGTVRFTRKGQVSGAAQATTVGTRPIMTTLQNGQILQQLVPNVNADLTPDGTYYWVEEDIVGSTPENYPITVPTGGPFDLWALKQQS